MVGAAVTGARARQTETPCRAPAAASTATAHSLASRSGCVRSAETGGACARNANPGPASAAAVPANTGTAGVLPGFSEADAGVGLARHFLALYHHYGEGLDIGVSPSYWFGLWRISMF